MATIALRNNKITSKFIYVTIIVIILLVVLLGYWFV